MPELLHLTIPVRTLTPFWLGDTAADRGALQPDSLIDSLRAWYEAIVRGMGGAACAPGHHTCHFDGEAYDKGLKRGKRGAELLSYAGLCAACQLFGAPGWPRRFQLAVDGFAPMPLFFVASPPMVPLAGNWLARTYACTGTPVHQPGHQDGRAVVFGSHAQWAARGHFDFVPVDAESAGVLARLAYLVDVVARYGAIGGETHNGFGQFIPLGLPTEMIERGRKLVEIDARVSRTVPQPAGAFSLGSFFARVYKLDEQQAAAYLGSLHEIGAAWPGYRNTFFPCSLDIRYKSRLGDPATGAAGFGMRPWFTAAWGRPAANRLLGEFLAPQPGGRRACAIHVSHIYRLSPQHPWLVKVWGSVPPGLQSAGGERQGLRDVIGTVNEFLSAPNGMFPGSKPVVAFIRKDVL